ncbi:uncharacterized protein DUF4998 [Flavobacteriaceae bacterium MAR_2010_72]|nr:uncharacterized protein DUF4998 [Flavobacteriaceae bacterium MAR_2010_72]
MQIKFSKLYVLALIMTVTIMGCEDMESIHEQYLTGEQVYAGKLDSLKVYSGFERVKIIGNTQYLGNSQEVTVSWDDQTRMFTIDQIVDNEFEMIVDGLAERNYEFDLYTIDAIGNLSVQQTVRGRAIGINFVSGQSPRRIIGYDLLPEGDFILWANSTESEYVVSTLVKYENNDGGMTEVIVLPEDNKTELINWKAEGIIEIISTIISGDNGFDLIALDTVQQILPNPPSGLDRDWTLAANVTVSKENPGGPNAGEGSLKVIDGDTNSKFLIFDYPTDFWMQQELPIAGVVNKYTLTSGNDAPSRDPKDWRLAGSNDQTIWVDLDTRSGESFAGRNETKEYTINSTTSYKYYRLYITANNGDGLFQLSEWRLYESDVPEIDLTGYLLKEITVSKENPGGPNAGEGSLKVVDGDTNTKFLIFDYPTNFWMQQELINGEIANLYTLTSGNDAPSRDPKNWTLAGSNDGASWVTLDTRTDESFGGRNETKEYTFNSVAPYKYYRMYITANNGDGLFQLSEWRMLRVAN